MSIKRAFWIVEVMFLFCGCNRTGDNYDYGMSVTIPKIVGTPASQFSNEELNLCKASNAFQIKALGQFYGQNQKQNIALSSLYLFPSLLNDTAFDYYFHSLFENFNLTDYSAEAVAQNFNSIYAIIKKTDSSLVLQSSIDTSQKRDLTISQSIEFVLFYDDAVQTQKAIYDAQKEVFSLSNEFRTYESEAETMAEVPLGNGNYSLVMIKPKGDLLSYVEDFTERRYVSLIDSLRPANVNITFPKFDFTTPNIHLPLPVFNNMDSKADSLSVKVSISVRSASPTYAMLKSVQSNESRRIAKADITDRTEFDRDFIFVIRGRYSNIILLLGVFSY